MISYLGKLWGDHHVGRLRASLVAVLQKFSLSFSIHMCMVHSALRISIALFVVVRLPSVTPGSAPPAGDGGGDEVCGKRCRFCGNTVVPIPAD